MERVGIRPATADDAEAISALILATLRVSSAADYLPEIIARVAADFDPEAVRGMIGRRRVLAAREGGRIVGTAALEDDAVRSVFVLPEAQGRGIGQTLMAEIARMAMDDGRAILRLRSSLTARGFYERLGFLAVGEALFGEERTVVMKRGLAPPSTPAGKM